MVGEGNQTRRRVLQNTAAGAGALTLGGLGTGTASAQVRGLSLVIGEAGAVTNRTRGRNDWDSVEFDDLLVGTLSTVLQEPPIVTMKPVSYNGANPCHVRLRNVTTEGFEYQVEEWDYLDGSHGTERLSWVALVPGVYEIRTVSGVTTGIEAGTVPTTNEAQDIGFDFEFDNPPVVVAQSQTRNGRQPIVTRLEVGSSEGFNVRLQEEEAEPTYHRTEEVGYIAAEETTGGILDSLGLDGVLTTEFEARRPTKKVKDSPDESTRIPFKVNDRDGFSKTPRVVADIQTRRGPEPCQLRRTALTREYMDLFVEEEQSANTETNHSPEDVGFIGFGGSGLLPGVNLDLNL